ncbi:ATP-dependent zinc metalloprotease FtsH [Corynebacterium choanae]|uniref:ATP-dependent zinc metalloprotease FtsH n=1 Tax=Corynebacterium choanae TaxID=1862358 RepID=A0A3G6J752_9CORY|nr:ATP-dependent zinc metalloprotease FtsH [Corynebacterium choanae]AZA12748.1 ATP-dependent zinc metalloprotease FtsH [Corynebacterium choanae]
MANKKILRFGLLAATILIVLYMVTVFTDDSRGFVKVDTSQAVSQLTDNNVKKARIDDREQQLLLELKHPISVEKVEGVEKITTQYPARATDQVFDLVKASDAESYTTKVTKESFIGSMITLLLPMLLFFALIMFVFSRMQGSSMGMFGFGASRAKELTKDMPTNTFADVAGAEEAVDELHEIKDFLEDPSRYEQLGAKIPRGVLLYGPPGTGKTLLARAVAGEAGVPFYSISGSDFVEMFVGVGASRVRDLFKQAKENSPCIIFVDEIDAVGRQRGSGMGGGHDEREQTLNQLLVEMDGFGDREGVILMAATNRPDILDPALLRPGRFDRQIPVTNPDLAGREQILQVHAKGKPLAPDVDLSALAKRTAGMSGADLANVLNEAALLTARVGGNIITADALEEATDRVVGGPRRSSMIISEQEKKITAYHEGGHTLAAWAMQDIDRVHKVTILARGKTGGHAMTAGDDDKGMYTRNELFARLVFAMGGRAAEEVVFGQPTTGASSDIEHATKIARAMVCEYGMSPVVGAVKFGVEDGDPFSGQGGGGSLEYSPATAATIDEQVQYVLHLAHEEAYAILRENRDYLDRLAAKLLEKETLRRPDLEALFDGLTPRPRLEVFPNENAQFGKQPDRNPVKTPNEIAKEQGTEPPKRFSILEASKAARARREAAQRNTATGSGHGGMSGSGAAVSYGGTPPPANWEVPTLSGTPAQHDTPDRQTPATPAVPQPEHPGVGAYPADGTSTASSPAAGQASSAAAPAADEPLIGFRLPDNERPDHAEADGWGATRYRSQFDDLAEAQSAAGDTTADSQPDNFTDSPQDHQPARHAGPDTDTGDTPRGVSAGGAQATDTAGGHAAPVDASNTADPFADPAANNSTPAAPGEPSWPEPEEPSEKDR